MKWQFNKENKMITYVRKEGKYDVYHADTLQEFRMITHKKGYIKIEDKHGKYNTWLLDGKLHREDGPSCEGEETKWHLKGKEYTESEWKELV